MRLNWRFTYSNRMAKHQQPDPHGLFDAKVPRYTSYPPANHFLPDAGRVHQADWLTSVPDGSEVSLYLHIPFCKRLSELGARPYRFYGATVAGSSSFVLWIQVFGDTRRGTIDVILN